MSNGPFLDRDTFYTNSSYNPEAVYKKVAEIDSDVKDIKQNGVGQGTVKKVNGVSPDSNGNVTLNIDTANLATKADIQSIAKGAPSGVYATLAALQTAFPTGNSNIYVVTADGKWYYWSGAAWTVGGQYQAPLSVGSTLGTSATVVPSQKTVTNELGTGFTVADTYLETSGALNKTANAIGRYITDFIRLPSGKNITFYAESNNQYVAFLGYYDKNKQAISTMSNNQTTVAEQTVLAAQIPVNAMYVRLGTSAALLDKSYVTFSGGVQGLVQDVEQSLQTTFNSKLDKKTGKNLFNKDSANIIMGQYLTSTGGFGGNASYFTSDFMPVEPNQQYYHINFALGGAYACIYDNNKAFVASFKESPIAIPANGYFVRMSGTIANMPIQQFEKGAVGTTYEPFTDFAPLLALQQKFPAEEVTTVLPKKMYFVKDKQANVYYENVLFKNLNDPTSVFFDRGTNYNRQVAFNFSAAATAQTMTALIARNFAKGETKTITYDVIDPAVNTGKVTNMLFIGDSFTDMGNYVKETKSLLSSKGVTANLIGTCGDGSTFNAEGLSGGTLSNTFLTNSQGVARIVQVTGVTVMPSTGYPGQTYRDANGKDWIVRGGKLDGSGNGKLVVTKSGATEADFTGFPASGTLTKQTAGVGQQTINYTSATSAYFNPFINPTTGVLDITNYITSWGFNVPNIVVFQFTWNDLAIWANDGQVDTLVNSFKTAADHVHTAYPNAKVIISVEPFGSINGNKDWNGKKYAVLKLVKKLLTTFEDNSSYNTWLKIAPSYAFVDLIYGYANSTVVPSDRYPAVTEQAGGDGVHPSTGMLQIADCIYPIVQHLLTLG